MDTPTEPGGIRWSHGDRFTKAIHVFFGGVAGVILFAIMVVTVIDVVGRYVFDAPLPGAFEITQFLMAGLIYGALPSVSRQEGHITIDLLDPVTPTLLVRVRQILINSIVFICLAIISWRLWILAQKINAYGDVTEYLRMPEAPIIYFMAILSMVATVVVLSNIFRYLRGAREPAPGFI